MKEMTWFVRRRSRGEGGVELQLELGVVCGRVGRSWCRVYSGSVCL